MNESMCVVVLLQFVFLIGLVYTLRIDFILNRYSKKVKILTILQIIGSFLLTVGILGYTSIMYLNLFSANTFSFVLLTYIGAALMMMPCKFSKLFKIDREFVAQLAIIVVFMIYAFLVGIPYSDIFLGAMGIIMISLIRSLISICALSIFLRTTLRLASWLIVIQTLINPSIPEIPITCKHFFVLFTYFVSLLLWQYSAVRIYNMWRWM